MQYQPVATSVAVVIPLTPEDYKRNPEIRSTRCTILVILSIDMVLAIFYFIVNITSAILYHDSSGKSDNTSPLIRPVVAVLRGGIPVIYIFVFIKMITRYRRIGILIFAWLTVIQIIVVTGWVILSLVILAKFITLKNSIEPLITVAMIYIIRIFINILLQVLLAVFSFKLAKLIKKLKVHQIVENLNN